MRSLFFALLFPLTAMAQEFVQVRQSDAGWCVAPSFAIPWETKLAGARKLHVRLQAPKNLLWRVLLAEDAASKPDHAGRNGADGESFTTDMQRGTGEVQDVTVWLGDLQVREEYGNTKGNHRLDLDGLENIGIAIPESGKQGEMKILTLELLQ